jgi:quinoprotein glucose dehydrogenase
VDNGKELWSYKLPTGTEGIPALYQVDGKSYLVVCATTPLRFGRDDPDDNVPPGAAPAQAATAGSANNKNSYIVFALPDIK